MKMKISKKNPSSAIKKVNVNEEHTVPPPYIDININKNVITKVEKPAEKEREFNGVGHDGVIMNPKSEDRPTSFFAQPGILAGEHYSLIYILFAIIKEYFLYSFLNSIQYSILQPSASFTFIEY